MCRQIVFSGTCPQCNQQFIWQDLSQELSCLEAKNTGVFGQCTFGVQIEEHRFDQECEPCAADNERDEGYCAADADGMDNNTDKGKKHADFIADGAQQQQDGGKRKKQRVA
ncbi:hypothetical protein QBC32DRAFT_372178 [Pseudoneurospora amorphoporcata]|uniref:Uncharacterized protein n=1 Tax=Pseudoneurospora amorphoporcata TaxID=241081 RepID=A0AAN6NQE2_9PEZI|nr:hypothetical protein QBC32DRAFT_372178 [Pseudoneurospora amorphoporcata]